MLGREVAAVDLFWLTATVRSLAAAAYDQRHLPEGALAPDRLTVLEDAGCTDAGLFAHLHGPGPQVRGCGALDLLLDKR